MATCQRTLEFEINKQRLKKKPSCDFSGLIAGSVGYLRAKFYLSPEEWYECNVKIARFWLEEQEYSVKLDKNDSCVIPSEVLVGESFKVSVLGVGDKYRIETNRTKVRQGVN